MFRFKFCLQWRQWQWRRENLCATAPLQLPFWNHDQASMLITALLNYSTNVLDIVVRVFKSSHVRDLIQALGTPLCAMLTAAAYRSCMFALSMR